MIYQQSIKFFLNSLLIGFVIFTIYKISYKNDTNINYKLKEEIKNIKYKDNNLDAMNLYLRNNIFSKTKKNCDFNSMIMLLSLDKEFVNFFKLRTFHQSTQPVCVIIKDMWNNIFQNSDFNLSETIKSLHNCLELKKYIALDGKTSKMSLHILLETLFNENKDDGSNNFFHRYSLEYKYYISCKQCNIVSVTSEFNFYLFIHCDFDELENYFKTNWDFIPSNTLMCQNNACHQSLQLIKNQKVDCIFGQTLFIYKSDTSNENTDKSKKYPHNTIKIKNIHFKLYGFMGLRNNKQQKISYTVIKEDKKWIEYNDGERTEIQEDYINEGQDEIYLALYQQEKQKFPFKIF